MTVRQGGAEEERVTRPCVGEIRFLPSLVNGSLRSIQALHRTKHL